MKRVFSLVLLLLWQAVVAQDVPAPARSTRVVSSDERVTVIGASAPACSTILTRATNLRKELKVNIQQLGSEVNESQFALKNNLIITLVGQPGNPAPPSNYRIRVRSVEGSQRLRIELYIHLAKGLDQDRLRASLLECILMDHSLDGPLEENQIINVAPWLIAGISEKMAWRNNEADRGLYRALFKNDLMMAVEDLLNLEDPTKLDAAQRTSFRISSGAFVMAMLNQEEGSQTFLNYLATAPTYEGEPLLLFLNSFFTGGLSEQGLAKWWALQLANLTQDFVSETLTLLESEESLSEVLKGTLEDENGQIRNYRLIAYRDILALPKEKRELLISPILERLGLLAFRCFPSYRDLIVGYSHIARQLLEGDETDVPKLLEFLEKKRIDLEKVGERTRDYLDWYQITNATEVTGEFADYQRLKRELKTKTTSHQGSIERYLDAVQGLYTK